MKVTAYVHVRGEGGKSAILAPGDAVPAWATVTNPDVLDGQPEETAEEAPEPTPEPAPAPRKRTSRKAATS